MPNSSFRRIVTGIIFFSLTVVTAVIGYMAAGWNFLDAIYMVVITIFGVGYGEVQPLTSPPLKVFTIFVIIAGALSVAYTVSGFVQMITEGEIHRALNVKRMTKEIAGLEDHVIICGFGRIGQLVARKLKRDRQPFIIVDNDPERVALAQEQGYLMYQGNATDEMALEAAGILRAKSLATVLPNDAANVFITLTAREMNPNLMILARGEMPSTEKKLRLAGANHVVLPASISALRMAHLISHPSAVDFLSQTDGQHGLNEFLAELDIQLNELVINAASPLIGGTIGDIEVKGQGTFITVALRRADGEVIIHPSRATYLALGDSIILMGHQGDMPNFAQQNAMKKEMRYRGARLR
ncbi:MULTISPECIES: potassium channel protein [Cyanophyceae]|uniref:potassium channel family protein n=1 Tax=Cyanophyceae TaxID=3028117 RepID=UPI0016831B29|nr:MULTISPECIES: potassium channel protein [Cyanophyceae]MBD1915070.1 NAD-binding protein [Phormidium sp. FACHB-77]MBD2030816.1 NAD-binding protein [Phormidium sp. FACHB-322]MBD2053170.1 NAD-binding protein [Leptolyngbya sp. FACHB-60]